MVGFLGDDVGGLLAYFRLRTSEEWSGAFEAEERGLDPSMGVWL